MRIHFLPVVVCACAPSLDRPALDADEPAVSSSSGLPFEALPPPPPPGLVLTAEDPHPGGVVHLAISGALPGESVVFLQSLGGIGNGPCPGPLGGLCLDLGGGTQVLGNGVADGAGVAERTIAVAPAATVGATLTFQAAVRRGAGGAASVKSNPVVTEVGAPSYAHVVAVDGSLADWTADELFDTTSADGSLVGVTWDATHVYVAFQHPDVSAGGGQHWQVAYLGDGGPGSTTGPTLNTQSPTLPFAASHVIRRKADGSYDDLLRWDEIVGDWVSTPAWLGTGGSGAAEAGDTLELAIPRDELADSVIELVLASAYEGSGFESTYAGAPADAFVDGYDPDPATFLRLDLSLPDPAVVQNP